MKINFGHETNYTFKHIIIDEKFGFPITVEGVEVGGILMDLMKEGKNGRTVCRIVGMEIKPEHRKKGIGRRVVKILKKKFEGILGAITEDPPKKFWKRCGAEFRLIPLETFPEHQLKTVYTKEPVLFMISADKQLREDIFNMMESTYETLIEANKHWIRNEKGEVVKREKPLPSK